MTQPTGVLSGPSGLSDPVLEAQFLDEFRGTALRWSAYAAAAGSLMFACFLAIAWFREPHTSAAIVIRIAMVIFLAVVCYCMWNRRGIDSRNYPVVAGFASAVVLGMTVIMPALPSDGVQPVATSASPAIMFCVFLHYGFLRLPLSVAMAIGWSASAVALFTAPMVIGGSEIFRNAVYLTASNVFGMILARLVEKRERELFFQRRQAETARAEARLKQAEAEEADRQKTRLIAAVSHDLRQPMTAAVAYLDVLLARLGGDDLTGARASAEKAQSAVGILGATLDHLLTAARYDSGTEAIDVKRVDPAPLLRDLHDAYVGEAERRGIRLRFRVPAHPFSLVTDARSLHRVLSNLLANAVKFTPPRLDSRGEVLVAIRHYGDRCRIDVIDTGMGIAPADLDDIWKPYVQLNNTERDRERGLGLGLFLVQRIIEQLPGHSVEVRSVPGRGSRFTVVLPAVPGTQAPVVAPVDAVASSALDLEALRGAYVLLLEDDRDARTSIVELMSQWGVLTTASATLGDLLAEHDGSERSVDAIVCDYRLSGGTNGIDAIARIRTVLRYAPPAVLITGEPDLDPLRAAAGPGTTVLHKPFSPRSLAEPLLRAVRHARDLEEG